MPWLWPVLCASVFASMQLYGLAWVEVTTEKPYTWLAARTVPFRFGSQAMPQAAPCLRINTTRSAAAVLRLVRTAAKLPEWVFATPALAQLIAERSQRTPR